MATRTVRPADLEPGRRGPTLAELLAWLDDHTPDDYEAPSAGALP